MNLLSLIPGVVKILGNVLGLGDKAKEIAEAIAGAPPELRAQMQQAVMAHEAEMKLLTIEELKTVMSETNIMIQSSDKFVSRARPTGLYVAYAISLVLAGGLFVGKVIDPAAILTLCAPMYGAQGYYMHLRTREKTNGNHNGD